MEQPHEYKMGGGWGDAIRWFNEEEFEQEPTYETQFTVVRWKQRIPEVGDLVKGEFERSWITFRFVDVKPCGNPKDMFFGKVVIVTQEMKPGHESGND